MVTHIDLDECMRCALARAEWCIIERKVIEKFCNAANINVVFFDYLSKMNNLATSSAKKNIILCMSEIFMETRSAEGRFFEQSESEELYELIEFTLHRGHAKLGL